MRRNLPLALTSLLLVAGSAQGATVYVAPGGSDAGDCSNPLTPCATIQTAVDQAGAGDTVRVAIGAYTSATGESVVTLGTNLTLDGGWNAAFTTQAGLATINGEGVRRGIDVGVGLTATVRRFVIRNGYTSGLGGGIFNLGTLTVERSSIRGNYAYAAGAGIFSSGALTIRDSGIVDNATTQNAGGIYTFGTFTADNTTIAGNRAGVGGGLLKDTSSGSVVLSNVTITGNAATSLAGAMFVFGDVTIRNSIVAQNRSARRGENCYGELASVSRTLLGDTAGCTFPPGPGNLVGVPAGLGSAVGEPAYVPLAQDSPAVNAGDPAGCAGSSGPLPNDQRGAPRLGPCDMGAYEYRPPGPAARLEPAGGTPQRSAPRSRFPVALAAAVLDAIGSPVPSATVSFTTPGGGASGTFPGGGASVSIASDSFGIADTTLTANGTFGSYSVTAATGGVATPVVFALTNAGWFVSPTGNDANDCQTAATPCATVEAALQKPGFQPSDTVLLASGRYVAIPNPPPAAVVVVGKSARLSGGWDATFTVQTGHSTFDGQDLRPALVVSVSAAETVRLERLILEHGRSDFTGGGLSAQGVVLLEDSVVALNRADGGGGIRNAGLLTLVRTRVEDNRATDTTGGGILNEGSLFVTGSAILRNRAPDGGGIGNAEEGNLVLENSTVSDNRAEAAGGGLQSLGAARISSATIYGNAAVTGGGGLDLGALASLRLRNTIVAGNSAAAAPDCQVTNAFESLGYNLFGSVPGCLLQPGPGDLGPLDPAVSPLVGSPAYHPLLEGSPAIDAGDPSGCQGESGALDTDQRGLARQGRCDIGAYEYAPAGPPAQVQALAGTPQRAPLLAQFPELLQAAVLDAVGTPVGAVAVAFRAPASGASATFSNSHSFTTLALSDAGGIAIAAPLTANGSGGEYLVQGEVPGAQSAAFSLANTRGLFVATTGNDANSCLSPPSACRTINRALVGVEPGETIHVASGTYTDPLVPVVNLPEPADVTFSGGWNPGFSAQSGFSTIDAQGINPGAVIHGVVSMRRFIVQNGARPLGGLGGGVENSGILTLDECVVQNNTRGGIWNSGGLTLNRSVVRANTNDTGAGGIDTTASSTTVLNDSTVSGNHTTSDGGGLRHGGSTLTLNNSTVSGNTADVGGGGISNTIAGSLIISNSTLTANVGGGGGGGVYNTAPAVATMSNSILAGNTGGLSFGGPDCLGGPITSVGYNLVGIVSCVFMAAPTDLTGSSAFPLDAKVGPLADNGGPTPTHALLPGSPAIDSGSNAICPPSDQRGRFRPVDGDGNGTVVCDRGAVEQGATALVSLSINDVTVTEGNGGTINATFTLSLSAPSSRTVSVFATSYDGTATAGLDYVGFSDSVVFAPGVTQRTVAVPVIGDRINEPSEVFSIVLSGETNAVVTKATGVATILDNDAPGLAITPTRVTEPVTGVALAVLTVTLAPPSAGTVTVDFVTGDDTAVAPGDYQSASGTLTFAPGTTTQTIGVTVEADALREGPETFLVTLSNATGGPVIVVPQATVTIAEPGSFYTLTPCRVLDTRNPVSAFGGPALQAGTTRVFSLAGRCGIPPTASAVSVNLTVTQPTAAGNLRLYPAGSPVPTVSALNYAAGATRGNNALASLNGLGELSIRCAQATGTANVILDVNGYFE